MSVPRDTHVWSIALVHEQGKGWSATVVGPSMDAEYTPEIDPAAVLGQVAGDIEMSEYAAFVDGRKARERKGI